MPYATHIRRRFLKFWSKMMQADVFLRVFGTH
ncbi:hypothetical protein PVAP13_5NG231943 [Panicum virgatum]|uniref:Uncharacterized protein n=1 Tax=Panicum virgatum TaxID=38727 RepID=A0A8T0RVC3_PANVG|nr:hypothetical protein PVAP13_5NG231943 [Panicum virgatum]